MINRIVKLTFKPENVDSFQILFKSVNLRILAFEGCKGVKLLRDTHNSNVFFTYSYWENEKSLESYRKSALFDDTWTKTKALFDAKPEAWSLLEQ